MEISSIGLIDDDDILLDIAALALSQQDHSKIDLQPYLEILREIEERVCEEGRDAVLPGERAAMLSRVLHDELGFSGDGEYYDAPINADFIRVLDRRRGLPISLAILYVAMARRAGWYAYVLNVPGHVLVQIGKANPVIIDPFHGGVPVSQADLAHICQSYLGDAGDSAVWQVTPMTNREVLSRLLVNQAIRAEQKGNLKRALKVYQRITKVAPHNLDAWRQLMRLHLGFDDVKSARDCLSAMFEITSDKDSREQIMKLFKSLDPSQKQARS